VFTDEFHRRTLDQRVATGCDRRAQHLRLLREAGGHPPPGRPRGPRRRLAVLLVRAARRLDSRALA